MGELAAGRRFEHGVVDSTSERAFAALAEGSALHGDRHLAHSQTAGRGRLGRSWLSPPGEGLYLSVVLRPERPYDPVALTMGTGLAVLDALRGAGLDTAWLDWPNDVMVGEAKLAGILAEARGGAACVLGVGMNLLQRSFAPELLEERAVTSLCLQGLSIAARELEDRICSHLEDRLEQVTTAAPALARDFLSATGLGDSPVRVEVASGEVLEGICSGLELSRGLCVTSERDGQPRGAPRWVALAHVRAVERQPAP